ncbi:MAG: hypothetical protein WD249_05130 [Gaiellaceae bacterium]
MLPLNFLDSSLRLVKVAAEGAGQLLLEIGTGDEFGRPFYNSARAEDLERNHVAGFIQVHKPVNDLNGSRDLRAFAHYDR